MNESIKLKSAKQVDHAIECVKQALTETNLHEVVIREFKESRSAAQNRLLWLWMTEIGNERGEMKEEIYHEYKGKFLVNIFERDDEQYAEMMVALRNVWKADLHAESKDLHKQIVNLTSTTSCNVEQMCEFLNLIEMDAAQNGIQLTRPGHYGLAVGVE